MPLIEIADAKVFECEGQARWRISLHLPEQRNSIPYQIIPYKDHYVALPGRCPHEGADLEDIPVDRDGVLRCLRHGLRFDLHEPCMPHYKAWRLDNGRFLVEVGDESHPSRGQGPDSQELREELETLREANAALERVVLDNTTTLETLLQQQENQHDELQRQTRALASINTYMERVFATMAEIIILLGPDGRIARVNNLFAEDLGFPPEAVTGRLLEEFLAPHALAALQTPQARDGVPPLLKAIRASGGRLEEEMHFLAADGKNEIPYILRASLMHGKSGKLEGAVVVASNISVLKARETSLQESRRELMATAEELALHRDNLTLLVAEQTRDIVKAKNEAEAASRAKSEFLANMSHEVRTPMNAIIGMTDLVLRSALEHQQRNYVNKIRSAADHLLSILDDILDFSKIEAGKLALEKISFQLPELIDAVTDLMADSIDTKGLELDVDLSPEAARAFIGDPLRLRQILINLIGNALKFSERGTITLSITLEQDDGTDAILGFAVQDEGIGISADVQKTLFDMFSQADTSTTRRYGGTGLGLAICRRLVEMMNGQISVTSAPGQGSTFRFNVRLGVPEAVPSRIGRMAEILGPRATGPVMVVDDNPVARRIIEAQCRQLGLEPEIYASGAEALAALDRMQDPRHLFVLVDWLMPDMDGAATIKALRQSGKCGCPILVITAHPRDDVLQKMGADITGILPKPCSTARLFAAMAAALGIHPASDLLPGRPASLPEACARLQGADILIVDDVPLNQELMRDLIESAGMTARTADNGLLALQEIHRQKPDLVLMDCQMPTMDGFEATRQLRAHPDTRDLPIIALTAGVMAKDRTQCIEAGMDGYVSKPVNFSELLALMDQLVPPRTPSSPQAAPAPAPAGSDTLPDLPGIDQEAGLRVVNRKMALFRKVLGMFRDGPATTFPAEFNDALAAGQFEEARRHVHSLKGAAGNIGAETLRGLAATVESGLRLETPAVVPDQLAQLLAELDRVAKGLAVLPKP